MPQLIGGLIVLYLAIIVIAAVVWVVQWVWAGCVYIYDIVLMPLFVYFLPGIFVSLLVIGVIIGSWIAAKNYFILISRNVSPEDLLGKFIKSTIIGILGISLVGIYTPFLGYSGLILFKSGYEFSNAVQQHYIAVQFPAFRIHFPFWYK